jgi:hypothetical protein
MHHFHYKRRLNLPPGSIVIVIENVNQRDLEIMKMKSIIERDCCEALSSICLTFCKLRSWSSGQSFCAAAWSSLLQN